MSRKNIGKIKNMQKGRTQNPEKSALGRNLIFGIGGVALFYWLFEIALQMVATPNASMTELLIGSDLNETIRRVTVLIFFIIFASHTHSSVTKRREAEEANFKAQAEEAKLRKVAMGLSKELNLKRLLRMILETATEILDVDGGNIFTQDRKTGELVSVLAQGLEGKKIRLKKTVGLVGVTFTNIRTIVTKDATKDKRFNQTVDGIPGHVTKSTLGVPIMNKKGFPMGVIQLINKHTGSFTIEDEKKLEFFAAQTSVAIENASLFENVVSLKNYNERVLESLSNGVISLDENMRIVKGNAASHRILESENLSFRPIDSIFPSWVIECVKDVFATGVEESTVDTELTLLNGEVATVNLTVSPLLNHKKEIVGAILVLEDITKEKRVKRTMARYMTKEIADKLLEIDGSVLGGVTQEATVMFSDIRNFSRMAEQMKPEDTVSFLNDYFTMMVDIIFDNKGILDKYIGDGLMAVFGAPVATDRDIDNAIQAAVEMMSALNRFNQKRAADGSLPINIGIGLNTDEIISGNIGSSKRMDYTVIGDGVNLAFRLEQATKFYRTNILLSEATYDRIKADYSIRKIDKIRVKGKNLPVSIYQLLDYYDETSFPHLSEVVDLYSQGMEAYEAGDWNKGLNLFSNAYEKNSKDYPSRIFMQRCQHYVKHPPQADWDGVWDISA